MIKHFILWLQPLLAILLLGGLPAHAQCRSETKEGQSYEKLHNFISVERAHSNTRKLPNAYPAPEPDMSPPLLGRLSGIQPIVLDAPKLLYTINIPVQNRAAFVSHPPKAQDATAPPFA